MNRAREFGQYELRVYSIFDKLSYSVQSNNLKALNYQADRLIAHWRVNGILGPRVEVGRVLTHEAELDV